MRVFFKSTRYYYWLVSGFIRKYSKVMAVVFVIAFFALLFSRSIVDSFAYILNLNKMKVGLLAQGNRERIPSEVLANISTPIVAFDEKGRFKAALANRWTVEDDGKEYVFMFPKDLRWQDGSPFRVQDIDFSIFNFTDIKAEILDDSTIRFKLKERLSNFPSLLTVPVIKNNLVGINGRYKLSRVKYQFGEVKSVNLIPLESGLPFLIYKFYNTQDDLALAYKLGEVDAMSVNSKDLAEYFRKWRNTEITESVDYRRIVTLFLNNQKAPFDNKNLRSAIALGINYHNFAEEGSRAFSPITPISWVYNPEVKEYNYEPEISASLVEKNNSSDKAITLHTSYELNRLAEGIRADLNETGLKVEIRYVNYIPTDYDMFLTIWEPPVDPDQYVFWHQTQRVGNLSRLKNVKADLLLEQGRKEISPTKRRQIYYKFQELIVDEVPAVFLYFPKKYTIQRK